MKSGDRAGEDSVGRNGASRRRDPHSYCGRSERGTSSGLLEEPDSSSEAGPSRLKGEAGAAKRKKRMAAAADEQGQSRSKKRKVGKKESTVAARLRQARRRKNNPTSSEDSESSGRGT